MSLFSYIKQQLTIESLVSEYTTLKRAGSYLKGACPFHAEKTPSFTVSPDKDIFYCFGCHEGGDIISFMAKIENCTQLEAAKLLIERYSINIPEDIDSTWKNIKNKEDNKNRYYKLCKLITQWCYNKLAKYPTSYKYLISRNITKDNIKKFLLGYFPNKTEINDLLIYIKKNNFLLQDLLDYGIVINSKMGLYSPFEDRVMFPIKDHLGNICGFGGRILDNNITSIRPKYYNSKENSYFCKKSLLFGLDLAKKDIQTKSCAFLVEGYTDVIAMHQHGYLNTIATLGTSCTLEHLQQISRYAEKLYVLYDSDNAGQKAILRLTELCFEANIDLYVTLLPEKEDPATYLEKYKNLDNILENSKDIFEYYISTISNNFNEKSTQEKLSITKNFIKIFAKIKDNLKQDLLLEKASLAFNIPVNTLKKEIYLINKPNIQVNRKDNLVQSLNTTGTNNIKTSTITELDKNLVSLIISKKEEFKNYKNKNLVIELLPAEIKQIFKNNQSFYDSLDISNLPQEEKQAISKIILDIKNNSGSLEAVLQQFYKKHWKNIVYSVKLKIKQAEKENNIELIQKLLNYLQSVQEKIIRGANE